MSELSPTLERVRDQLVTGIPRFERKRRRRRFAGASFICVLLVTAGFVVLARDPVSQSKVNTGPATPAPERTPGAGGVERISAGGTPALLFASTGNRGDVAAIDLLGGVRAVYGSGTHEVGTGGLTDAVFTNRGDLVFWNVWRRALVFPAERLANGGSALLDTLGEPAREIGSFTGERTLVPTDDGEAVWILGYSDDTDMALELIDVGTGATRSSTVVPARSRVVDVVGDQAVIELAGPQTVGRVMLVGPAGATSMLEVPEPAEFVTATPGESIWFVGGSPAATGADTLMIIDSEGERSTLPTPAPGLWGTTGHVTIPSTSPPMPTVTADGRRLLLSLIDPTDPNGVADRVVVVDLRTQLAKVVYEGSGASSAFWAGDDRTVIAISRNELGNQAIEVVDSTTGSRTRINDAIPAGFFVIAGR